MPEETDRRSTTELKVRITEDKDGNFNVEHLCTLLGTDVVIPMRPSHVAGQLFSAGFVLLAQSYAGFSSKIQSMAPTPEPTPERGKSTVGRKKRAVGKA